MIYTAYYDSPVGKVLLAESEEKLIGLWIKEQKKFLDSVKENIIEKETSCLIKTKNWLDSYCLGDKPKISQLNLAPRGGEFRQTVWKYLCEIPYGEVTTYGKIAEDVCKGMGKTRMSAQAVGGAVGHNPISIIIPCHRVIGANGNLTGYAGGIDTKIKLLKFEGVDTTKFYY